MYTLELTEEELEFVYTRCLRKAMRLEESHLEDTPCYELSSKIMQKIYEARKTCPDKEIKYWIIKNPDTGLYYRGKGENRWGKYYNQASIFRIRGQVEESCNWINKCHQDGEHAVIVEIKISEV